jgi:acylphosphatase
LSAGGTRSGSGEDSSRLVTRHVTISGRVQGVGFRHATWLTARRAGVAGWVRNLPDGRVEALVQGRARAVEEVLDWIRRGGPPLGQVTRAQVEDAAVDPGLLEFSIRH